MSRARVPIGILALFMMSWAAPAVGKGRTSISETAQIRDTIEQRRRYCKACGTAAVTIAVRGVNLCQHVGALREHGQALVADLGEAAGHRDFLGLRSGRAVDRDVAVP